VNVVITGGAVTVADMAAALQRVAGPEAGARIDWIPTRRWPRS